MTGRFAFATARRLKWLAAAGVLVAAPFAAAEPLVTGLEGASGSTIGPGGALYVTEGAAGRVSRVDPQTGEVTPFASGLPRSLIGIGGAIDLAFIGSKAYVLVTLVGSDVVELIGSDLDGSVVGIYRIDGPSDFTVVADIGQFALDNPPPPADWGFFVETGVQYAIEPYRGGFLVTDGHHNRVLQVQLKGDSSEISVFRQFGNIVPTGLAISGSTVYMAEAGPIPHLPEDGRVVAFGPKSAKEKVIASGAPLLVDVEFGRGRTLYALAQGDWEGDEGQDGTPAQPDTGSLVQVNANGTFTPIIEGLDQPASMQFIGNTVYIVTLEGDILRFDDVSDPPFGKAR